jgi:hypothetical protein
MACLFAYRCVPRPLQSRCSRAVDQSSQMSRVVAQDAPPPFLDPDHATIRPDSSGGLLNHLFLYLRLCRLTPISSGQQEDQLDSEFLLSDGLSKRLGRYRSKRRLHVGRVSRAYLIRVDPCNDSRTAERIVGPSNGFLKRIIFCCESPLSCSAKS